MSEDAAKAVYWTVARCRYCNLPKDDMKQVATDDPRFVAYVCVKCERTCGLPNGKEWGR